MQQTLPNKTRCRRMENSLQKLQKGTRHHISTQYCSHKTNTLLFLLKKENQPEYIACQTAYTIEYILIKCDFAVITKRNKRIDNILSFVKEVKSYQKI